MHRLKNACVVLLGLAAYVGLFVGGELLFVAVLRLAPPHTENEPPLPDFDDGYEACRTNPACH